MPKKIVVLAMSCQQDMFMHMEQVSRETWAKPILDGKYDNITYYSYIGGCEDSYIDEDKKVIYCKSKDNIWSTHQKTVEALRLLFDSGNEFDYIFRTNTSTVNNIGLLNAFVDTLTDDKIVYGGELYSIGIPCPTNAFLYLRGNSILLSRFYCNLLLESERYLRIPDEGFADDNVIGNIINCYHLLRYEPYIKYLKSYGFGWYKSIDFEGKKYNNGCCTWYNTNDKYDYLKNFISIQIKVYTDDRTVEEKRMRHISNVILNGGTTDYSSELEFIRKYSEDPFFWYTNNKKHYTQYVKLKDAVKLPKKDES